MHTIHCAFLYLWFNSQSSSCESSNQPPWLPSKWQIWQKAKTMRNDWLCKLIKYILPKQKFSLSVSKVRALHLMASRGHTHLFCMTPDTKFLPIISIDMYNNAVFITCNSKVFPIRQILWDLVSADKRVLTNLS